MRSGTDMFVHELSTVLDRHWLAYGHASGCVAFQVMNIFLYNSASSRNNFCKIKVMAAIISSRQSFDQSFIMPRMLERQAMIFTEIYEIRVSDSG